MKAEGYKKTQEGISAKRKAELDKIYIDIIKTGKPFRELMEKFGTGAKDGKYELSPFKLNKGQN